ncbi:VOC family protein [Phytomonospora endophytica]|uniref:Putative enzyme related to lactoylglutathione lyase n=1 Tax=Phytomonospora endophytica TaxID=714109 RepID=A0A841FKI6_9ACTN|nr:VOC family protein [Phytomonospora endophytica]MBB6035443.1 putative enzyme related to lactoylglutathione lyase [Phytomonospora endophytica]GIG63804.1 hypothetical protein Pen01_00990 [Phytomonospora endophytica]
MVTFRSVSPVLPVGDITAAIGHYRTLGFAVTAYEGAEPYAFARRGDVELHLAQVDEIEPSRSLVSVYLYIDDADALAAEWAAAGADGRFVAPVDTPYGLREGAHVDTDGNLLRYGSPLKG